MTRPAPARAGLGGIALTLAVCFAGSFFGAGALPSEGVQAAMAEWGAERLGVAWSEPPEARIAARAIALRLARGVVLGLAAAGATYAFAIATHAMTGVAPTITGWLVGVAALGDALLASVRDEMLLHGVALRVIDPWRAGAGPKVRALAIAACGAASAAWALGNAGNAGLPLAALAFEALAGAAFGATWLASGGAQVPVAAHVAFRFATRGATRAAAAATAWGGGDAGLLAGWSAVVVALAACAAASTWALRRLHEPPAAGEKSDLPPTNG